MLTLALVVLAPAASLAGMYQAQQMEVGAALELRKDGHFRYQLDYGVVSKQAEGDWTSDGQTVRLTTKPRPSAPTFELIRDVAAPEGQVTIALDPPGFGEGIALKRLPPTPHPESRVWLPPTIRAVSTPAGTSSRQ